MLARKERSQARNAAREKLLPTVALEFVRSLREVLRRFGEHGDPGAESHGIPRACAAQPRDTRSAAAHLQAFGLSTSCTSKLPA